MSLPSRLATLLRDAGISVDADALAMIPVDLDDGTILEVMAMEAVGAPDEFEAMVFAVPSIFKRTADGRIDLSPPSDEFLNELLLANGNRGIGTFALVEMDRVQIETFVCRATVALRAMTPAGLSVVLKSLASVAREYQQKLNAL